VQGTLEALSFEAVSAPVLDPFDLVYVIDDDTGAIDAHVVSEISVAPVAGTMSITTRSRRVQI
jgi:hypothetical protein